MLILARFRRRVSLSYVLVLLLAMVALVCIVQTIPAVDEHRDRWISIPKVSSEQGKNVYDEKQSENLVEGGFETLVPSFQEISSPLGFSKKQTVVLPSILDALPHLDGQTNALQPIINYPNDTIRSGVNIVIGLPTVTRKGVSYLLQTLQSLIFATSATEREQVLIVLMIADEESNTTAIQQKIASIVIDFNEYFESGLLHVIVPPKIWYPNDLHQIESTLGDPPERMYWRTKQNLDYLYLMLYCQSLGQYYLQIEDDVLTKKDFVTTIRQKITQRKSVQWFTIDFSSFGFIGKLFKSTNLQYLIHYIALLHRYKPVDWILDTVFYDRYCIPFDNAKNCTKAFRKFRPRGPTLFQHVGTQSSLEGKVQRLKEKNFGETMSFNPNKENPVANVSTSLNHYRDYTLERLYKGFSPFWSAGAPQKGDFINIQFLQPTAVKGFLIRTGNAEHPKDIFDEKTAVTYKFSADDEFGPHLSFSNHGIARVNFDTATEISLVRIEIKENYTNWVVISEIMIRI